MRSASSLFGLFTRLLTGKAVMSCAGNGCSIAWGIAVSAVVSHAS